MAFRRGRGRAQLGPGDECVPEIRPFEMKGRDAGLVRARCRPHRSEHFEPVQPLLVDASLRQPISKGGQFGLGRAVRRRACKQRRPVAIGEEERLREGFERAPRLRAMTPFASASASVARMLTIASDAGR